MSEYEIDAEIAAESGTENNKEIRKYEDHILGLIIDQKSVGEEKLQCIRQSNEHIRWAALCSFLYNLDNSFLRCLRLLRLGTHSATHGSSAIWQ